MLTTMLCAAYLLIGVAFWFVVHIGTEGQYGQGDGCDQCEDVRRRYPVLAHLMPALSIVLCWGLLLPAVMVVLACRRGRREQQP